MAIIGIDLGTTNSLACVCIKGETVLVPNPLGETLTPSVVSVNEAGEVCVGAVAKERLVSHPEEAADSFKRYMGTSKTLQLAGRSFTPQELSSFVLRQLKEDAERFLGEEVTEAIISVPAYFNDNQRYATREAGQLAGLVVERLVNEPSAAALAASRISGEEEQSYLVFDFGGGTLDVSVVDFFDNVIEILAVSGDNKLGGNDFDLVIGQRFCRQNQINYEEMDPQHRATLLRLAENCKRDLSVKDGAILTFEMEGESRSMSLSNVELAEASQDLFGRISLVVTQALKDSGCTIDEIDEVVLVGGSSKMPVLSFYLEALLGRKPRTIGSPDEVVAMGAGVFAAIKERSQEVKDLVLTDICPFSLGVEVVNRADIDKSIMSPVIERNSILPTSKYGHYSNAWDYQDHITIAIYQGDSYYCRDNLKLGEIEMEVTPAKEGQNHLEVCFTYDINGILEVEVMDRIKNQRRCETFTSENSRMSPQEIQQRLAELQAYKMMPPGGIRTELVLARGERLFAELFGDRRRVVADVMEGLQKGIAQKESDQQMKKLCRQANDVFDRLEGIER